MWLLIGLIRRDKIHVMKVIKFDIPEHVNISEFQKAIGFVSEDILRFNFDNSTLTVEIKDCADIDKLTADVKHLLLKYVSTEQIEKELFSHIKEISLFYNNFSQIHNFEPGMIGLSKKALFLYKYFDQRFTQFALQIKDNYCYEKQYPVLLPLGSYKKTGYLNNSPQYSIFCCCAHENISELEKVSDSVEKGGIKSLLHSPQYALSPSACFHTYIEYENQLLPHMSTITFAQSVFRNEGRFNFNEFGRLRDYHVREIVFIGDEDYVANRRKIIMEYAIEFVRQLDLAGNLVSASDPFIMPKIQKYKKMQIMESSKYELRLQCERDKYISVASFNLHGTAFTYPFNIKVENCDETVTGCIGFGLERWILAFLSQYGEIIENWPEMVRSAYANQENKLTDAICGIM